METYFVMSIIVLVLLLMGFFAYSAGSSEYKSKINSDGVYRRELASMLTDIRRDIHHMEVNAKGISDKKGKDCLEKNILLIDKTVDYIDELNKRTINGNL